MTPSKSPSTPLTIQGKIEVKISELMRTPSKYRGDEQQLVGLLRECKDKICDQAELIAEFEKYRETMARIFGVGEGLSFVHRAAELFQAERDCVALRQQLTARDERIRELERENGALGSWSCFKCGARFDTIIRDEDLEGMTTCSSCVEKEILTAKNNRLKKQLTALQAAQEWREVESDPPTENGRYVVTAPVYGTNAFSMWSEQHCVWKDGEFNSRASHWTHWKPLGEHPKL